MSTGSTRRCPGDGDLSIDLSDVAERISLRRQLLSTAYVASWQILLQKSLATLLNNDSFALMRFALLEPTLGILGALGSIVTFIVLNDPAYDRTISL